MEHGKVEDFMNRDVATIQGDAEIHELEKLLLAERIHGVPVVDQKGQLVGVVSQTDVLSWHFCTGVDGAGFHESAEHRVQGLRITDIRTARVDEVMSPIVHCILPRQPAALAAARMLERRIHRLVVVNEEGCVLGILSSIDLLRAIPGAERALDQARDERVPRRQLRAHPDVLPG